MSQISALPRAKNATLSLILPFFITIFISAFLLFQVQPLIAKYILPWFGGTPAVWSTSMLFFQVFLLVGYTYAHLSINYLKPRTQAIVHGVLLIVALIQLPIIPSEAWQPTGADNPALRILLLLTLTVGLPYVTLASTAPLIQAWYARSTQGQSPYRLYALSNAGSLLGLMTYPFIFEPLLGRVSQAVIWSVGFGIYLVACALTAYRASQFKPLEETSAETTSSESPTWGRRLLWISLSMTAVILLLAFTSQLTQDMAPIPFLWVLPLALYLLTFIIAFDNDQWYSRPVFAVLLIIAGAFVLRIMALLPNVAINTQIIGFSGALFVLCMFCHGELARLRPSPSHLTGYYLTISLGGALGGVFVALIAPAIFADFYEFHVGLVAVGILALYLLVFQEEDNLAQTENAPAWLFAIGLAAFLGLMVFTTRDIARTRATVAAQSRNFYGSLALWEHNIDQPNESRWLLHGVIFHGMQFTQPPKTLEPTTYFFPQTGVGRTLTYYTDTQDNKRVGILGMGVGTLVTYGEAGDYFRVYEINPDVQDYAEEYFTYLDDTPAEVDIILGDGRLSLEREDPQQFDVLVLDAFAGDAVPTHLLTQEALEIYLNHTAEGGAIVFNVTNRHLDLGPVLTDLALANDLTALRVTTNPIGDGDEWADWMILTRNDALLTESGMANLGEITTEGGSSSVRLWTDDYTALFPIVRWENDLEEFFSIR